MSFLRMLLALSCLFALGLGGLPASESAPDFGKSVTAGRGDPLPTLDQLRGKVVLLLFFQEWCPICNAWSAGLISQLEKAYAPDPRVVLVGVKTDGDAASGKAYLVSKGADLDRWLVLSDADATYVTWLLGQEDLWQYAVIAPDGSLVTQGKAGTYFTGGAEKRFVLPADAIGNAYGTGVRPILTGTYSQALERAVHLAEANFPSEAIAAASASGDPQAKDFREDLLGSLTTRVDAEAAILAEVARTAADRIAAYEQLTRLAMALKGSAPGKTAAKALSEAGKDKEFKAEVAALNAWVAMQAKLALASVDQANAAKIEAYPRFITSHEGTVAAGWARTALTGN